MQIKIEKNSLLRLCKNAAIIATEKKTGNFIGAQALLAAEPGRVSLVVTDLDEELVVTLSLDSVIKPGSVVVPFKKISDVCRAITENVQLNIVVVGEKVEIESTFGFFAINCKPKEDFPLLTKDGFNQGFIISSKILLELVNKTAFSMGEDDNRNFLNGVFFCFTKENVFAVATDGHRLAHFALSFSGITDKEFKFLLPRKSVFDLLKLLSDLSAEEQITIELSEKKAKISFDQTVFTTKLLAGAFPAYQKLIPRGTKLLVVNREPLKACLLRAAALLGDRSQGVKLLLAHNLLTVTAKADNNDIIQEQLSVQYQGEPLEICFNIKYLLDFLSAIDGEMVKIKLENTLTGALLQDQNLACSYVLMPMQL